VRREKEAEAERFAGEKAKYEAKIKDLEQQIRMLRNESGDIMQELEKKMMMLIQAHEQEKTQLNKDHEIELKNNADEGERKLRELREKYER
jgi:hypothetical protein